LLPTAKRALHVFFPEINLHPGQTLGDIIVIQDKVRILKHSMLHQLSTKYHICRVSERTSVAKYVQILWHKCFLCQFCYSFEVLLRPALPWEWSSLKGKATQRIYGRPIGTGHK